VFLFKASGATYRKVVRQSKHAFPVRPVDVAVDEFVLLSKNREDCATSEKQIQHVAKVLAVRSPDDGELEAAFPNVHASERFRCVVELYWGRPLARPFNLSGVPGLNYKRYDTVQDFAKLDEADSLAIVRHLTTTNSELLLEFVNDAERP
jgi:hypothetical protein